MFIYEIFYKFFLYMCVCQKTSRCLTSLYNIHDQIGAMCKEVGFAETVVPFFTTGFIITSDRICSHKGFLPIFKQNNYWVCYIIIRKLCRVANFLAWQQMGNSFHFQYKNFRWFHLELNMLVAMRLLFSVVLSITTTGCDLTHPMTYVCII